MIQGFISLPTVLRQLQTPPSFPHNPMQPLDKAHHRDHYFVAMPSTFRFHKCLTPLDSSFDYGGPDVFQYTAYNKAEAKRLR